MREEISLIVNSIKGKNIRVRRIKALEAAGYTVSKFGELKWNWGRSGDTKQDGNDVLVQLECAEGGRSKNGYHVNACYIYKVTK